MADNTSEMLKLAKQQSLTAADAPQCSVLVDPPSSFHLDVQLSRQTHVHRVHSTLAHLSDGSEQKGWGSAAARSNTLLANEDEWLMTLTADTGGVAERLRFAAAT